MRIDKLKNKINILKKKTFLLYIHITLAMFWNEWTGFRKLDFLNHLIRKQSLISLILIILSNTSRYLSSEHVGGCHQSYTWCNKLASWFCSYWISIIIKANEIVVINLFGSWKLASILDCFFLNVFLSTALACSTWSSSSITTPSFFSLNIVTIIKCFKMSYWFGEFIW